MLLVRRNMCPAFLFVCFCFSILPPVFYFISTLPWNCGMFSRLNFAILFQQNKQILIDAVVHAVNEDYAEMANDFTRLGFLASGTDVAPIVPALEAIWQNSVGKGLADFNFRSVTGPLHASVYTWKSFHFVSSPFWLGCSCLPCSVFVWYVCILHNCSTIHNALPILKMKHKVFPTEKLQNKYF